MQIQFCAMLTGVNTGYKTLMCPHTAKFSRCVMGVVSTYLKSRLR
jgi:hypothetical protein